MTKIHILSKDIINKIAAGEVIEKPASVVKELVENSLDAGAKNITIEIKQGGKKSIIITDDGSGIPKEELATAIKQHATSKLRDEDDLFNILTLGFRGEALSSICSISNFEIVSRPGDQEKASKVSVIDGKLKTEDTIAADYGTKVIVNDLFYNTPARQKYLCAEKKEFDSIMSIATRFAFSHPDVNIRLIHDNKLCLNSRQTKDLLNTVAMVWGTDVAKNMIAIDHKSEHFSIKGYISKPYITKIDRSFQMLYVNKRFVKSKIVSKAIKDAYHSTLFLERHPVTLLYITINPKELDVNVHPTKEVIRIEKEDELYSAIYAAIKKALEESNLTPKVSVAKDASIRDYSAELVADEDKTKSIPKPSAVSQKSKYAVESSSQKLISETLDEDDDDNNNQSETKEALPEVKQAPTADNKLTDKFGTLKIIGQLNRTYILIESEEGLLLLDQHAAEERVNFERIKSVYKEKSIRTQSLLEPIMFDVSIEEKNTIESATEKLKEFGFKVEKFGDLSFRITQIPFFFGKLPKPGLKDLVLELVHEINSNRVPETLYDLIARKACRMSLKAGATLTMPEMSNILERLPYCEQPFSCPHGRPTIVSLSHKEIEKLFKRVA